MKLLLTLTFFLSLNCFSIEPIEGSWQLLTVVESPLSAHDTTPFPKSITIEFTGEGEGKLTIKLPTQSKVKTYDFSKTVTTSTTFQTYNPDEEPYALKEETTTAYLEGILNVQLTWIQPTCEERMEQGISKENTVCLELGVETINKIEGVVTVKPNVLATGSYTFSSNGNRLHFTRTNIKQNEETIFKALYILTE
jgi:hypothetical protein